MKKKQGVIFSLILLIGIFLSRCTQHPLPELAVSISSSTLLQGSRAVIHVKVINPSKNNWKDYKLIISYTTEKDQSTGQIAELPLSLVAGQTFEQDIPWFANFRSNEELNYQVRLTLISTDSVPLAETSMPIQLVQPTVTVSVNPTQLSQGEQATIGLQVNNPSGVEMQNCILRVSYGEKNMDGYMIQDLPINLKAGETFNQDITWTAVSVPFDRKYEIRTILIKKDSSLEVHSEVPIMLTAP